MCTYAINAAVVVGCFLLVAPLSAEAGEQDVVGALLSLPSPPEVEGLVGFAAAYTKGRNVHLPLIRREANRNGVPPDLVDAVAYVESAYNPKAFGAVGEVGLMQIRPQTAAMLGYRGTVAGLFEPDTNVRYSAAYLAAAWRLAKGDFCRALMKYRAGHGEERMTPLSVDYCRRAKKYLATLGSPLGQGTLPAASAHTDRTEGAPEARFTMRSPLMASRTMAGRSRLKGAAFWAAHEARIKLMTARVKTAQLRIAARH